MPKLFYRPPIRRDDILVSAKSNLEPEVFRVEHRRKGVVVDVHESDEECELCDSLNTESHDG